MGTLLTVSRLASLAEADRNDCDNVLSVCLSVCPQPNCSLHLHILAIRETGYQSILTQDSAIGLIMAAGNLGSSLSADISQVLVGVAKGLSLGPPGLAAQ